MISLRNRRSKRALLATVAAGMLIAGPAAVSAQEAVQTPKTHTVKKGDTLWDLAALYLGDAFRWPELYRLNTDVVEDPHWIYPGEILKLPGYVGTQTPALTEPGRAAVDVTPPAALPLDTVRPSTGPTSFSRRGVPVGQPARVVSDSGGARMMEPDRQRPTVLHGDYIRAPYVDRMKGPPVWGRILGSAEIPGIEPARQRGRFQMNDRVLIAPPTGSVGAERELYLAYQNGPRLEEVGQVILPTGVVEVVRSPVNGEAAIATIVQMYGNVSERDRLMPFQGSPSVAGAPTPIRNGRQGDIRWIMDEPVLPSVNYFVVLSLTLADDVKAGDEVEIFKPRKKAQEEGEYATPEIAIGRAQIIRVTPFGATAKITVLEQPKVEVGNKVRVIAKMQ